ncbi:MAG TPA: SIS domain-containing protein, partial [Chthoniobacterales bacterium]|nr:SIS domain-containing protein [Chthoniobacterales bacterium]
MNEKMSDPTEVLRDSIRDVCRTFESLEELAQPIARFADVLTEALAAGRKLLVCGNGGSAADSADFTTEFACRFLNDR